MDPFQSVGLQSSWMSMVAHGVPGVVPPAPSIVIASTTNREYVESTTTNIVNTVLNIAKDASEMFKNVPYIKALAGIVIQIISIREVREQSGERNALPLLDSQEIQTEKDQSQAFIDKILRRSKVILDGLLRVASSQNRDQLKDIEGKLKEYNEYGLQLYPLSSLLIFRSVSLAKLSRCSGHTHQKTCLIKLSTGT